jgi:hypothetical protein
MILIKNVSSESTGFWSKLKSAFKGKEKKEEIEPGKYSSCRESGNARACRGAGDRGA